MRRTPRPELERLVARMHMPAFAMPLRMCGPVYDTIVADARAQRVLLALFWMAAPSLKDGVMGIFRAPLWEVSAAAGCERMSGNAPVRRALPILAEETWRIRASGASTPIFQHVGLVEGGAGPLVEWVPDADVAVEFAAPARYALLDIRSLASLSTAVELFLYIHLRVIWRRRIRRIVVDMGDVERVCGTDGRPRKRTMENLRRTARRMSGFMGEDVHVFLPDDARGRQYREIVIEVGTGRDG